MTFSQRLGFKPVKEILQIESIDDDLKNSLWSVYLNSFLYPIKNNSYKEGYPLYNYTIAIWVSFFKLPIDEAPVYHPTKDADSDRVIAIIKNRFLKSINWYDPYDILEFTVQFANKSFTQEINSILGREKSGYRLVNNQFTQITSQTEITEIEDALNLKNPLKSVNTHLNAALKLLSDKIAPDYRNSIKESISAVESICKSYVKDEKATLGETLSLLEKSNKLHPALKKAFSSLYGYTSDESGIRHSLIENGREVDFHEAKFMLVICSSFINFLVSKM